MLAHKLPDEVPIWLLFEIEPQIEATKALEMVSKEGFEHFKIALRGKELPIEGYRWDDQGLYQNSVKTSVGAVYPSTPNPRFEELLHIEPVKVVFETFLAEQWDGLDRMHVLSDGLTTQGRRMLQGFAAAGGEVVFH
jgi:hypothetical protein